MNKKFINLLSILLFIPALSIAEMKMSEVKMPDSLSSDITYLLDLAVDKSRDSFDPAQIDRLLNFMLCPKDGPVLYYPHKKFDGSAAYHEFELKGNLSRILKFAYDPDIPSNVDSPSSIRLAYWKEINGNEKKVLPHLWRLIPGLKKPVIVRGIEHEEITPDLFTGAYYQYDVNRTLILFKYHNKNGFISLAKQKNRSDVGRKGIVLGADKDWNYFYTGQKGLPLFGLGFLHSYMYDSCSIIIYLESETNPKKVKCCILKWLKAGWKSINMVRNHHIHRGLKRYTVTLKNILENPDLPAMSELSTQFSNIKGLSNQDLKIKIIEYLDFLEQTYGNTRVLPGISFSKLINKSPYIDQMNRREMESILCLEYMKGVLGKKGYAIKKPN